MKINLGDFKAKVWRENIFKPTIGNQSLHQESNENCVRIVNIALQKIYMLRARCSHTETCIKYTWNSPDEETHKQVDHTLIDRRRSIILNVLYFRGSDCDTDHYLVIAKVREILAVSKETAQRKGKDLISGS